MDRINVSITREDKEFIKSRQLKASHLLRQAIQGFKESAVNDLTGHTKELNRKLENFQKKAVEMRDFLEKKGLIDEFLSSA